jgi:hypothetical protein
MFTKRSFVPLLLVLMLIFSSAVPAQAGIMDSITGFFSKASDTVKGWFSGGGTKEFEQMLQQVEASQGVVADKQNAILDKVSRNGNSSINPKDPAYQKSMNELAEASRANEALYIKFLKVRQELVDSKKDVSKYDGNFNRIQETQHNLEEGAQAIQKASREEGAFTPPADVAAASNGALWADPKVKKYMDEWLAANGLDKFGRLLGGVVIAVIEPDMDGKTREQWLWENMFSNRGNITGSTLEAYVKSRMNGGEAAGASVQVPAANTSGGSQVADRSSSTAPVASGSTSSVSIPSGATLSDTDAQLKTAMASYEKLAADGKGNSEEATELLNNIKVLKGQRDQMISEGTAASGN